MKNIVFESSNYVYIEAACWIRLLDVRIRLLNRIQTYPRVPTDAFIEIG